MKDGGEIGKREGMRRAYQHADPHWVQCMFECGKRVCENQPWFTSETVVLLCAELHPNASTHEKRAIGHILLQMAKWGWCEKTDETSEARRAVSHKNPKRVWWSLLYKGPQVRPKPRRRKPLDPRQFKLPLEEAQHAI